MDWIRPHLPWVLALILSPCVAFSEPFFGLDYLALQHRNFPVKRAMKVYRGVKNPALGYLHGTFGKRMRGVKRFIRMNRDKPHLIRVHLYNAVCVRHNNCAPRELRPSWGVDDWNRALAFPTKRLIKDIQNRVLEVRLGLEKWASENTHLAMSIALEDNLHPEAARELTRIVREVWPYELIRNPVSPFESVASTDALELHTAHSLLGQGLYLYGSMDGVSVRFPHRKPSTEKFLTAQDIKAFLRRGKGRVKALFLWDGAHQGLSKGGTTSAPKPFDRDIRVDSRDITFLRGLLRQTNQ